VAVTPGTDFDPDHGDGFIRFSYAGSTADMRQAVERLAQWAASR
jgi:aspartate/methionine/tyrosine aminotransferase